MGDHGHVRAFAAHGVSELCPIRDGYTPGEESSGVYLVRSEGGGCGIRTHERLAPLAVFKTAAIGH